jgi:transposase
MIALNRRTKVFICKEPTHMTLSYDGLFQKVKKTLKNDPFSGHLFVFVNRRRTTCKALYYDQTGFVIVGKRMDRRRHFACVNPRYKKPLRLTESEFGMYFEGADLEKRFIDTAPPVKRNGINLLPFLKTHSKTKGDGSSGGEKSNQ